jgi:acetylornithine deacetylase/succinyl-diaminopimelate desuccinylase-like protein
MLSDLIALPSVNPAFLPPGDPLAGEQRVAEFLAATAARAGLDTEFEPVLPRRSNLLARLAPVRPIRHRLLLAPHLDTVGPADHANDLFTPHRRDGRLHGRGACDTKGSAAAMMAALCELATSRRRPAHTEIVFAGLVDEEAGQAGSRALAASGFTADLAIVGEPTRLKVVTAHKGVLWLQLETRGKAAHAARPELGRNAVHDMARIVEALQTDYAVRLRRQRHHALLGHPTVNVGAIHGGRQPNIVPARCVIAVDRRTLPGETNTRVEREIRGLLRQKRLAATFRCTQAGPCLPLETNPRHRWIRDFLRVAGQRQPAGVDYFSDAGVLASAGIPSVVFGPGDIAQAHTPDEWISLRQLEQAKELLVRFLRALP